MHNALAETPPPAQVLFHGPAALSWPGPATPAVPRPQEPACPLVLRTDDGQTREVKHALRVGTAPDNNWVLCDPQVSRHHLLLVPERGRLRIKDLGSTNGTFLNGARIEQGELAPGARLVLGSTRMQLAQGAGANQLLGPSRQMAQVRQQIECLAPRALHVLILGESGTGKELVARALHEGSGRTGPFIALNCGALSRDLIESELFGHDRGAFTGAQRRHLGCFGEAHGGTLFLDEIAELPLDLQPRLLRALENGCIRPVGTAREVPVDVRIVSATHADLGEAVARRQFREDLYYRLAGMELRLPPLRERRGDVAFLVRHFLREQAGAAPSCTIDDAELEVLERHPWPGNVRQLRNAVHRAVHLGGPVLRAGDFLGPSRQPVAPPAQPCPGGTQGGVPVLMRPFSEIERDVYRLVLEQTSHNRRAAAEMLQLSKSTFYDRLHRLGLATKSGG